VTIPKLDLKTLHSPTDLTVEQLAMLVRQVNDNQRRLMEAWAESRKQIEAIQIVLENARQTGGL
jgi:hypothetical protein